MNDKKERVYSEEDLCEYTVLQKIDELEKQLKNIKNEFNGMYETKEAADTIHRLLRSNDAKINNRIDGLYNITPTDVGVKDNKLGLLHDTTWLTNQGAINLDGFTYDEATKTLKVTGGSGEETRTSEYKSVVLKAKHYEAGEFISGGISSNPAKSVTGIYIPYQSTTHGAPTVIVGDAVFIPYAYPYYSSIDNNKMDCGLLCIKAGTVTEPTGAPMRLIYSY